MCLAKLFILKYALFLIQFVSAQQPGCQTVFRTVRHCLSSGPVEIQCPENHFIQIEKAEIFSSSSDRCENGVNDLNSCFVEDATTRLINNCEIFPNSNNIQRIRRRTCSYNLQTNRATACNSSAESQYLRYLLNCEPSHSTDQAIGLNMCQQRSQSDLSLATILYGGTQNNRPNCMSEVLVPENLQLKISLNYFVPFPIVTRQLALCSNRFILEIDNEQYMFCSQQNQTLTIPCQTSEKRIRVRYESDNNVDHLGAVVFTASEFGRFELISGLTYVKPTIPSTQTMTTASLKVSTQAFSTRPSNGTMKILEKTTLALSEQTTASSFVSTSQSSLNVGSLAGSVSAGFDWRIPVISACVILAILICLGFFLIIVLRNRKMSEKEADENDSQYAFVTDVYLDGDAPTKLVVEKNTARTASLGNIYVIQ